MEAHSRTKPGHGKDTPRSQKQPLPPQNVEKQKIETMGAFAMPVCQGQFSGPRYASLAESSVSSTLDLDLVAATFRENGRDDPTHKTKSNNAQLLQWQLRS
jgi:hypothetical protein